MCLPVNLFAKIHVEITHHRDSKSVKVNSFKNSNEEQCIFFQYSPSTDLVNTLRIKLATCRSCLDLQSGSLPLRRRNEKMRQKSIINTLFCTTNPVWHSCLFYKVKITELIAKPSKAPLPCLNTSESLQYLSMQYL